MLKKKNLIESGPSKLTCGEKFGQGHCYLGLGKCALQFTFQTVQYLTFLTAATHACTKTDPDTGEAIHTFETPYTTAHRIGGFIAVIKNSYSKCKSLKEVPFSGLGLEIFKLPHPQQLHEIRTLPGLRRPGGVHVSDMNRVSIVQFPVTSIDFPEMRGPKMNSVA